MSTSLFLLNRKVKLKDNVDFKQIVQKLKDENIDTKHIEDKEDLHSLFFTETDTWFLKKDLRAEATFNENQSAEISLQDFLHLIEYNEEKNVEKEILPKFKQKSKFITLISNDIILSLVKKKINYIKYIIDNEVLIIDYKKTTFKFAISKEKYDNFIKQL